MDRPFAPYEGTEPYIFVSYNHADSERVLPVLMELDHAGYRIWYDEGTPLASEWPVVIQKHLERCAVCLAFLSPAFAESIYCRNETHYAVKEKIPLLPAYLEKGKLGYGLDMQLAQYHSVNFYDYPNIGAFVEQLKQETFFNPCLSDSWHTDGEIRWSLDDKGLLTIPKVPDTNGEMPDYPYETCNGWVNRGFTPWDDKRREIVSLRIEASIIGIGWAAFAGCYNLISITIPDSVTNIRGDAFASCSRLESVIIPDSVISIGAEAFFNCVSLTNVTIPDSVQEIGSKAFAGTGLTKISLPAHTKIVEDTFMWIERRK